MALKISQLTPVAAGSLDGSEPVELGIAGDKSTPNGAFLPPGYIDGLKMVWVSGTALTVTSGAAYIPSLGRVARANAAIAKAGLSLAASTWYHAYLYLNAGVPDIEIVTTAPAAPYNGAARAKTGDTSRRYVGSVLTDVSGNIYNFYQSGTIVRWLENTTSGPFYLVAAGTATVPTTVSASGAVPLTACIAALSILNAATSASDVVLSNSSASVTLPGGYILFVFRGTAAVIDMALDGSQAYRYAYSSAPTGGASHHRCFGYTYER